MTEDSLVVPSTNEKAETLFEEISEYDSVDALRTWYELFQRIPSTANYLLEELSSNIKRLSLTSKRLLTVLALSAALVGGGMQAQELSAGEISADVVTPATLVVPENLSIVVIGDSNSAGNVLPETSYAWPYQLSEQLTDSYTNLDSRVTNCSIGGSTVSETDPEVSLNLNPTFRECLSKSEATTAIVMLSTNDALRYESEENVTEGFLNLVRSLQKQGIQEIVVVVPPRIVAPFNTASETEQQRYRKDDPNIRIQKYMQVFQSLDFQGMQFWLFEPEVNQQEPEIYDGIHLSVSQQKDLANEMIEVIEERSGQRTRPR